MCEASNAAETRCAKMRKNSNGQRPNEMSSVRKSHFRSRVEFGFRKFASRIDELWDKCTKMRRSVEKVKKNKVKTNLAFVSVVRSADAEIQCQKWRMAKSRRRKSYGSLASIGKEKKQK